MPKKRSFVDKSKISAVLFLGGKSTRMGSLTATKHKSLLTIGGFTILSHIYTQLRIFGINEIVFCTGYNYKKIIQYSKKQLLKDSNKILKILKKNNKKIPNIIFSNLSANNSTSERLIAANKLITNDNLLILYGDTLLKLSKNRYEEFLNRNNKSDVLLTVSNPIEKFGVAKFKKDKLISFSEKNYIKDRWVNSGWMIMKSKIIEKINKKNLNFESSILTKTNKFNIMVFKNKNYYIPIDNVADLNKANNDWKNNKKVWY